MADRQSGSAPRQAGFRRAARVFVRVQRRRRSGPASFWPRPAIAPSRAARPALFVGTSTKVSRGRRWLAIPAATANFSDLRLKFQFNVRPTRQDLVLSLLKVLMEVFPRRAIPVVVAFDQARRFADGTPRRRSASHAPRLFSPASCSTVSDRQHLFPGVRRARPVGNHFVPNSPGGYIQDRLNNPVHVPGHGTYKGLQPGSARQPDWCTTSPRPGYERVTLLP